MDKWLTHYSMSLYLWSLETLWVAVCDCSHHWWRSVTVWTRQEERIHTTSDHARESQLRAAFWYGD